MSSDAEQLEIKETVHLLALSNAKNNSDLNISVEGFLALVELGYFEDVAFILRSFVSFKEANAYRTVLELTFQNIPTSQIHEILKTIILINPIFFIGPVLNALETRSLNNSFFVENSENSIKLFKELCDYRKVENGGSNRVKTKHLIRFIVFFKLKPDSFKLDICDFISEELKKGNFEYSRFLIEYFNLEEVFTRERIFENFKKDPKRLNPVILYQFFLIEREVSLINKAIEENNVLIEIAAIFALSKLSSTVELNHFISRTGIVKIIPIRKILYYVNFNNSSEARRIRLLVEVVKKTIEEKIILSKIHNVFTCKISSVAENQCALQVYGISIKGRIFNSNLPKEINLNKKLKSISKIKFEAVLLDYNKDTSIGYFSATAVRFLDIINSKQIYTCKVLNNENNLLEISIEGIETKGFIPYHQVPFKLLEKINNSKALDGFDNLRATPYDLRPDGTLLFSIKKGIEINSFFSNNNNKNLEKRKMFNNKLANRANKENHSDLAVKLGEALANMKS